jgi:hypothetical protein
VSGITLQCPKVGATVLVLMNAGRCYEFDYTTKTYFLGLIPRGTYRKELEKVITVG